MITSFARRTCCLTATALCLLPAAAAAQDRWYGVRAGVNLTTLDSSFVSRDEVFDRATGIVAGAFVNLRLLGLDLQPEVLYVVKGAETIDFDITTRLRIDYLEFPVLIRFSRRVSDGVRLYAAAGPASRFGCGRLRGSSSTAATKRRMSTTRSSRSTSVSAPAVASSSAGS